MIGNDNELSALVNSIANIHHAAPVAMDIFTTRKAVVVDGSITVYEDPKELLPTTLVSTTLTAIRDYIKSGIAQADAATEQLIVHVVSPTEVSLIVPLHATARQKFVYMTSKPVRPDIAYGHFLDLEEAMIQLQSKFAQTDDQQLLIKFLGSVKVEASVDTADDGIGQRVTQKTGVVRTELVDVRNPWVLAPDRTFAEVDQPSSPFILRLDKSGKVALFEADGGSWRVEAIKSIGEWLRTELVAETSVTIIA